MRLHSFRAGDSWATYLEDGIVRGPARCYVSDAGVGWWFCTVQLVWVGLGTWVWVVDIGLDYEVDADEEGGRG